MYRRSSTRIQRSMMVGFATDFQAVDLV